MTSKEDLLNALTQKGWVFKPEINTLVDDDRNFEVPFVEECFSVDYGLLTFEEAKLIIELADRFKEDSKKWVQTWCNDYGLPVILTFIDNEGVTRYFKANEILNHQIIKDIEKEGADK